MRKVVTLVVIGIWFVMMHVRADLIDQAYDQAKGVHKEIKAEFDSFEDAYEEAAEVMAKSFPLYHMYYKQVFGLYDRFMMRLRGYKPDSVSGWSFHEVLMYHKINEDSLSGMEKFSEYSRKVLIDLKSIAALLDDIRDKLEEAVVKQGRGKFNRHHKKRGGSGHRSVEAVPMYSTSFFGKIEDISGKE